MLWEGKERELGSFAVGGEGRRVRELWEGKEGELGSFAVGGEGKRVRKLCCGRGRKES